MSETDVVDEEPQACPECGELRTLRMTDDPPTESYDNPHGSMSVEHQVGWWCDNPNCSTVADSDMAGPAAGEVERVRHAVEGDSGMADGR